MIRQVGKRFTALLMVFFMAFAIISETAVTALAAEDAYHAVSARIDEILMTYLGTTDHLTEDEIGAILVAGGEENARTAQAEVNALLASEDAAALTEEEIAALKEEKHQFVHFVEVLNAMFPEAVPIATNLTLSVDGLTASYDVDSWSVAENGTVTGTATVTTTTGSGCGSSTTYSATTSTLTLTNNSGEERVLSFDYKITANTGTVSVASGTNITTTTSSSYSGTVANGNSVTVTLVSGVSSGNTTSITLSNIKLASLEAQVSTVFQTGANGSYTVDGETITAETTKTASATSTYALVATPASGYKFVGWYKDGTCISTNASETLAAADCTVYPYFVLTTAPQFLVGTTTYYDLNEANAAAVSSGNTIILASDGTLPAGDYEISSGVKLLIPYDSSNTADFDDDVHRVTTRVNPSVYRTLNMASGAVINCYGSINVNATQYVATTQFTGEVSGPYGCIEMASGSYINLESGSYLYCYGFIGGSGEVVAKSGSKVYELFQIEDWRGGSNSTSLQDALVDNAFLLSSFYVQNVEATLRVYSGATVYGVAGIDVKILGDQHCSVAVVGSSGMFQLGDGSVATLTYEASTDRMILEFTGTLNTSSITISIKAGIGASLSMNSSDYILGIPSNYTVRIKAGSQLAFTERFRLLPGTQVYVEEGAEATIASGGAVYLYDADDWNAGKYTYTGDLWQLRYVHARKGAPVTRDTNSNALLQVDGTLEVQSGGALYTTSNTDNGGGANLTGSGTFISDNVTENTSFKEVEDSSTNLVSITCIPVVGSILGHSDLQSFGTGTYKGIDTDGDGTCDAWYQYTISGSGFTVVDTNNADTANDGISTVEGTTYIAGTSGNPISGMALTLQLNEDYCYSTASQTLPAGAWNADYTAYTLTSAANISGLSFQAHEIVAIGDHTDETCTTDGMTAGKKCTTCGLELEAREVIPAPGHTEVEFDNFNSGEATCTTGGYNKGVKCSVCNEVLVAQVYTAALGHNSDDEKQENVVAATCTAAGSYTKILSCSRCGEVQSTTYNVEIPALGHTAVTDAAVAPKCTATGLTEGSHCSECGDTIVAQTVIPALGHTAADAVKENEKAATCTAKGSYDSVVYCSVEECKAEISRTTVTVDKLAHTEAEAVKENETAATCSATGSYDSVVYCSVCKMELSRETVTVDKLAHTVVTDAAVAATCTATGLTEGSHCSVCNTVLVAQTEVPMIAHTAETLAYQAPTCTETGLQAGAKCSVCGYVIKAQEEIAALGHSYTSVVTAPTCTEAGYTTHTCSKCNDSYTSDEVAATGHTEVVDEAKTATCTATGLTEGKHCSVCNVVLVAQTEVKMLDHTLVTIEGKAATCTETGLTDGSYCSVCLNTIVEQETISALGHSPVVVSGTAPTCTATGWTEGSKCSVCGVTLTEQETIAALGHTAEVVAGTAATCTATGLTDGSKCSVCGVTLTEQETIDALGHSYNEGVVTTQPTCLDAGVKTYTCGTCECTYTESVAALGHDYVAVVTEPTCTAQGYTTHTCSRCNASYVDTYVAALGHSWDDGKVTAPTCTEDGYTTYTCSTCQLTKQENVVAATGHAYSSEVTEEPTCTATGERTYTCEDCDDSYTEPVEALGHSYTFVVTAPTCTEKGYTTYTCSRGEDCDAGEDADGHGKTYVADEVDALGHSYAAVVTDPTCTEGGYTTYTCATCGDSYVADATDALGHDIVADAAVAPGCESTGLTAGEHCSRCDYKVAQEVLAALGHNYEAVVTAPTCTEKGYTTYTCATCHDSYKGDYVDALGHDYVAVVTNPTCTEQGYTTHTCEECGDSYKETYVDALGHSYDEEITTAASCTTEGLKTFTCSCGDSYTEVIHATGHTTQTVTGYAATCTENGLTDGVWCSVCDTMVEPQAVIPALGHSYEAVVTDPTCTADGYTTYTCSVCSYSYDDDETDELGHTAADAEQENVTPATCQTNGSYELVVYCSVCNAQMSRETKSLDLDPNNHEWSHLDAVPATCTEAGHTGGSVCSCGAEKDTEEIPALGHDYGVNAIEAATCTEAGWQTYICTRDNCEATYTETISATGHTLTATAYQAPSCTEAGNNAYWTCSVCGKVYANEACTTETSEEGSVIPATGHNHSAVETAPTCTEQGYTTYTCSCGDSYVADYTDALEHSYDDGVVTTAPTCTGKGVKTYTCKRTGCGHTYTEEVAATGHSYTSEVTTQPTCTEKGVKTYTCSECDYSYTEDVAAKGHSYEAVVTDPTCTAQGYTTNTCSCGDSYVDQYVKANGHFTVETPYQDATCTEEGTQGYWTCSVCGKVYEDAACTTETTVADRVIAKLPHSYTAEVTTDPTCTDKGVKTYTCSCGDSYTEDVDALGHTMTATAYKAPTCTKAGTAGYYTCSVCGKVYEDAVGTTETTVEARVLAKLGHTYGEGEVTKAATCTAAGIMTYTCTVCSSTKTSTIKALGHDYTTVVTAPTCTKDGYTTYTCQREGCGYSYTGNTVAATGHSYEAVVTAPTCTEKGYTTYTCACGESYTGNETPAKGHSYTTVVTAPTCTEGGYTTYTCACGYSYTADGTPAKGHTEETIPGTPATCLNTGLTDGVKCSVCGEILTAQEVIPATDHSYTAKVTAPTCTEGGYTTYTCSCGDTYTADETAPAGHKNSAPVKENVVDATCYAQGSYDSVIYCSVCSVEISRTAMTIDKIAHTPAEAVIENEVAATCAAAGSYDEVVYCSVEACKHEISRTTKTTDKLEHTPAEAVEENRVEPGCTTDGGYDTVVYCAVCGEKISSEHTTLPSKGGHDYEDVQENVVAATCSATGSHDLVTQCKVCGYELVRQTITDPKLAHTEVVDAAVSANCTQTGLTEGSHCSVCNEVIKAQEVIPATGHKNAAAVQEDVVPATCYAEGSYNSVVYCSVCNEKLSSTPTTIEKIAHTPAEAVSENVVAATCTVDGSCEEVIYCSVCHAEISRTEKTIPAVGHTPGEAQQENVVAATCAAAGSYDEVIRCTVEGCVDADGKQTLISSISKTIAKLSHNAGEEAKEDEVPASCTVNGSYKMVVRCTECNAILSSRTETIQATGHTAGEAATCETAQVCTVCNIELAPATGHTAGTPKQENVVNATCTEPGSYEEVVYCTKCSKELSREAKVIEAKDHTVVIDPAVSAVCGVSGLTEGSHCSVCNAVLVAQEEIPALEHSWNAGIVTTKPTCEDVGVRTLTCTNCRTTTEVDEPALGHLLETVAAQKPTYTADGWYAYERCTRDECMYNTRVLIPALGEPVIDNFEDFIANLSILESIADTYVKKVSPGKDPASLIIKYIRTGVERYNSGSWNIMAGYEDTDFAKYVTNYEAEYNLALAGGEEMMKVSGLKNLENFALPSGDIADVGHIFGLMDISYTNLSNANVSGWGGDTVDLLSAADQYGVTSTTVEDLVTEISTKYFGKGSDELEEEFGEEVLEGSFSTTDVRGDLDGYYIIETLTATEYENQTLAEIFSNYMTASLTDEQRAAYFLANKLGGVTLRSDVRDAVFNEYCADKAIATLEGTREFKSSSEELVNMRKAVCYIFADYLCKLAGDYVETTTNPYLTVFDTQVSTLAPGVTEKIFNAKTADGETMVYYVTTADVTRDDVHVYANYNNNDPSEGWAMQRVLEQAQAAQANYSDPDNEKYIEDFNIVAAINADGFDMSNGRPSGLLLMEGVEYNPCNGNGFFGILTDGTAVIGTKADYEELKAAGLLKEGVGSFGGTLLIKEGQINVASSDSYWTGRSSRTAVGITATGKVIFMVVDGRQIGLSCGASDLEVAQILFDAGCYYAIHLDGGGSSTYVSKPEGESDLQVTSNPSDGAPRSVSSSLFIASTAPSSDDFDHAVIESDYNYLTIGSSVNLTAKGVSATGTPLDLPEGTVWSVADPTLGTITQDGVFTGEALGTVVVQLMADGEVIGTKNIYVVNPDNVYFANAKINAIYGKEVQLPVRAVYEGKEVAINENDVTLSLSVSTAGTIEGTTFVGNEASGIRTVDAIAALVADPSVTAKVTINLFSEDEASFDFDNATGGDRQFAYDREVSNATEVGTGLYVAVDPEADMTTSYTFALDMSVIPIPSQLEDLTYMLPGADIAGASAWTFLLQLAERVSVLTNVTPTLVFDSRFDVDYSEVTVSNEYFVLDESQIEFDETTNTLKLVLNWVDQEQPIDAETANPLCVVTGIKVTPKADADWGTNEQINAVHTGEISYDIYLRANALYSFAQKEENQQIYNLYPFENTEVIINDSTEKGGHFAEVYTTFEDAYTLSKSIKNGWVREDGGWAYYENGERYTGFKTVSGLYYNFGTDGINIGQSPYTGIMTIDDGEYYAIQGELYYGWLVVDETNVRYYNETTGLKESLTKSEVPSTCIVNGYCDYTSETGATKRVLYDDAGGHEWEIQDDGSRKCIKCGHVRVEITLDNVTLSYYETTYTGEARTPTTKVTAPDGSLLTNPSTSTTYDYTFTPAQKVYDYASSYANNVEVGTATVTVTAQRYGKYGDLNDWFGNAAGSVTVEYKILPDLPTKVRAEDGTDGMAKLTWQAAKAPGVTYVLYKSTDGENWTEFAATEATSYELDPKEYQGYQISIRTRKVVNEVEYLSTNRTVPTTLDVYLTVTNRESDGKPTLTWQTLYGATSYVVYRAEQADGEFVRKYPAEGVTYTGTSYTNTDAVAGKTYWYKVVTTLDTGAVRTSETIAITCLSVSEQVAVAVSNRADGKILLSWNAISGAASYEILRSAAQDGEYATLSTTGETSFTDLSAATGETWYYQVKATFVGGAEKTSEVVSGTCGQPNVVLNLTTGNRVDGKPTLSWSAIEGATSYEVYVSDQENGTYEKMGDAIQTTTAVHEAAEIGKTYWYKVKVIFTGGGEYTGTAVSGTCQDVTLEFALQAQNRVDGKPVLTWNAIEGATAYEIRYSITGVEPFTTLSTTQETSYAHADAVLGETYYYQVTATLAEGVKESAVIQCTCVEPNVVLDLTTGSREDGKPTLSWNAVEGTASYEIYISTDEDTGYEKVADATQTTFAHEAAQVGQTYYYKVKVLFTGGGEYLSDAVVNTCLNVDIPIQVTVSNRTDGKPVLSWSAIEGAASYEIWRGATEDGEFEKLDATQEITWTDTTAQIDETFYYMVKVILTSGAEGCSDAVAGTCVTPDVDWNIKSDHNELGKPVLTWDAVDGAISYGIYRSTTEDGEYIKVNFSTTGTRYVHSSATAGKTYYYKVEAVFSGGATSQSDAVSNMCLIPGADFEITVGNNDEGLPTLAWVKLVGAVQYEVYRSTREDGTYAKVFTTTGTTYTHTSATEGKTYYYYLKATYADGTTKDSETVVNSIYRPGSHLDVTAGNNAEGKPTLSWNEIDGAIKYQVWRSTTEDGTYVRVLTTTGTTYTHISATAGKTYYYKVCPVFSSGVGEFSDVVMNSCKYPEAQFNLTTGNRADGKPTLKWDKIEGAERYQVLRSTTEDGEYKQMFETTGLTYTNTGAVAGMTYYYKVRAVFGDGTEVVSDAVVNTCKIPGVQWEITTDNRADGKPTLKWESVEGAISYEVLRSNSETGTYAKVFSTKGTTYTHTSAEAGKTYYYKVRAIFADGSTDTSDWVPNTCVILGVEFDITTGNNETGKPTLKWAEIDGAASYEVLRSTSEDGTYTKVFSTTGLTYTHTSATEGKTYYYKLRVTLNDGTTETSDAVSNTCLITEVVFEVEVGNDENGKPTLDWEHIDAAAQYLVYRSSERDGEYEEVFETAGTSYTHVHATPGNTYYYKIVAILNDGSEETSLVYECECLSPVEVDWIITVGNNDDGKPTLKWEAVDGAISYEVQRATSENGTYSKALTTAGTTYTHISATAGKTYYYRIVATFSDGSTVTSHVVSNSIVTQEELSVETGFNVETGKPQLNWTALTGAVSYDVLRSDTGEEDSFVKVFPAEEDGAYTGTSYTHETAESGVTYYYQIVAILEDGSEVTSVVIEHGYVEEDA